MLLRLNPNAVRGLAKQPKNPETGFRKKQETASKGLGIYSWIRGYYAVSKGHKRDACASVDSASLIRDACASVGRDWAKITECSNPKPVIWIRELPNLVYAMHKPG